MKKMGPGNEMDPRRNEERVPGNEMDPRRNEERVPGNEMDPRRNEEGPRDLKGPKEVMNLKRRKNNARM